MRGNEKLHIKTVIGTDHTKVEVEMNKFSDAHDVRFSDIKFQCAESNGSVEFYFLGTIHYLPEETGVLTPEKKAERTAVLVRCPACQVEQPSSNVLCKECDGVLPQK